MSPIRKPRGLPRAAAILSAAILSACAVGPNFKRPAAPTVSDYTSPPLGGTTATPNTGAGEAQRFLKGSDVTGDWWTLYHSQPLDELIAQSLTANPDLGAARAALSVARENVLSQRGAYYPSLSAGFSASRQRQSGQIAPAPNSTCFSTTCSRRR
jgi:outer membrane protein TolC